MRFLLPARRQKNDESRGLQGSRLFSLYIIAFSVTILVFIDHISAHEGAVVVEVYLQRIYGETDQAGTT